MRAKSCFSIKMWLPTSVVHRSATLGWWAMEIQSEFTSYLCKRHHSAFSSGILPGYIQHCTLFCLLKLNPNKIWVNNSSSMKNFRSLKLQFEKSINNIRTFFFPFLFQFFFHHRVVKRIKSSLTSFGLSAGESFAYFCYMHIEIL